MHYNLCIILENYSYSISTLLRPAVLLLLLLLFCYCYDGLESACTIWGLYYIVPFLFLIRWWVEAVNGDWNLCEWRVETWVVLVWLEWLIEGSTPDWQVPPLDLPLPSNSMILVHALARIGRAFGSSALKASLCCGRGGGQMAIQQ